MFPVNSNISHSAFLHAEYQYSVLKSSIFQVEYYKINNGM